MRHWTGSVASSDINGEEIDENDGGSRSETGELDEESEKEGKMSGAGAGVDEVRRGGEDLSSSMEEPIEDKIELPSSDEVILLSAMISCSDFCVKTPF